MRIHWFWVVAGVGVGYFVLPKVLPQIKSKTGA